MLPTAIATSAGTPQAVRRGSRSWRTRHARFDRSFLGLASSGSACARRVVDWRLRATRPARGRRTGTPRRCAACSAIQPTREQPCMVVPARSRPRQCDCVRSVGSPRRCVVPAPHHRCRRRSGSPFQCLRSSTLTCLRRPRNSWMRTGSASARAAVDRDGCCKASWCVGSAVTHSMARWRAASSEDKGRPTTATIAAQARTRIGSVAKPSVAIARCVATSWKRRCGIKSRRCWPTRRGWRPSTSGARRQPETVTCIKTSMAWSGR